MKVLLINDGIHHKNLNSIIKYKNFSLSIVHNITEINNTDLNHYDCVISPCNPIGRETLLLYPNVLFIFGPHFFVFPCDNNKLECITDTNNDQIIKNTVYNTLCDWNYHVHSSFKETRKIKLIRIPFGVETDKFSDVPFENRTEVFVYYKQRQPQELQYILNFLNSKNITYKIFDYTSRYSEEEYLQHLQKSKYGIWIGRHESQGFALQEALSCNVPLCVWGVQNMSQEFGSHFFPYPASTVPYWDSRCGEIFYEPNDFNAIFDKFLLNVSNGNYSPREFIMENLSIDICEKRLFDLVEGHKSGKLTRQTYDSY
jgi:hypothetical protein